MRVIRTIHRSAYALVSVLLVLAPLTSASPAAAQARKIYISVDMEGISGISGGDQVASGGAEYGRSRKLMAEDLNAAIRGALEAGATDILVNDSHGGQRNLLPEDVHPAARLISHSFKRHGMMEGLDESFDGVIFIGYHAKAGAPRGLFAHTGSDVVRDLLHHRGLIVAGGHLARTQYASAVASPQPRRRTAADRGAHSARRFTGNLGPSGHGR